MSARILRLLVISALLSSLLVATPAAAIDGPFPEYAYFPWVPNGVSIDDPRGFETVGPFFGSIVVQNPSDEPILVYRIATHEGNTDPFQGPLLDPYASEIFTAEELGIPEGTGSGVILRGETMHGGNPMPISAVLKLAAPEPLTDDVFTGANHTIVSGYTGLNENQIGGEAVLPIAQTNNNWNTLIRATNFDGVVQTQIGLMLHPAGGGDPLGPFAQLALPGRTVTFDLLELGVPEEWIGFAELVSGTTIGAVAERVKNETSMLIINSSRSEPPQSNYQYAPLIFRDWFNWNTGISLLNAVDNQNVVTVHYYDLNGDEVHTDQILLPGGAMDFIYLPAGQGDEEFVGSAEIFSNSPLHVAVDEVKYLGDPAEGAGHAMSYMTEPYFAVVGQALALPLYQKGDSGSGLGDFSGLQLFNPTDDLVTFTRWFQNPDGSEAIPFAQVDVPLGARESVTIYSLNVPGLTDNFTGSVMVNMHTGDGGLVAVSNNVNYAVQHDGSASFNVPIIVFPDGPPLQPPNGFLAP